MREVGEQELPALEERGRVLQLGHVEPPDLVGQPVGARDHGEAQLVHLRDVADCQQAPLIGRRGQSYAGRRPSSSSELANPAKSAALSDRRSLVGARLL